MVGEVIVGVVSINVKLGNGDIAKLALDHVIFDFFLDIYWRINL